MRRLLISALSAMLIAPPALAGEVAASAPSDVSVTVYRAPARSAGSISLDTLGGFAVITETRTVTLPAGESELRFEGVADGIIPASAIVAGLPGGVIEKNRNAVLLSPSALARAAVGKDLILRRTDRATGKVRLVPATLVSATQDGVVFKTAAGNEALQCSGLPETFSYGRGGEGLYAQPTLSVKTRTRRVTTAQVTLTYIAENFDWSANYTAHLSPDGTTLDLGGWITLANGNSVTLANARTQIVAGGLNREYVRRFMSAEPQVVAQCWPAQTTSDVPLRPDRPYELVHPWMPGDRRLAEEIMVTAQRAKGVRYDMAVPAPVMAMAPPPPPAPEQLGDLKLYRVPERTTIAARQMKQTRLVDQPGVPLERIYRISTQAANHYAPEQMFTALALLRTRNDKEHKLGLPLPAGAFVVEQDHWGRTMLLGQPVLRDTAEGEKLELALGAAPDVTARRRTLRRDPKAPSSDPADLTAEMLALWRSGTSVEEFTLSNAADHPVRLELKLQLQGTAKVRRASLPLDKEDSQPILRIDLPANSVTRLHYTVDPN